MFRAKKSATSESVRIEGLEAVDRKLTLAGLKLSDLDFGGIARQGMRLAANFAPKRSGKLAASIKASKSKSRATIRAGGARLLYAGPINYGWKSRNIEASDFMGRADEVLRRTVPKELEQQVRRIIRSRGLA